MQTVIARDRFLFRGGLVPVLGLGVAYLLSNYPARAQQPGQQPLTANNAANPAPTAPREDKDVDTIKQRLYAALLPTSTVEAQALTKQAQPLMDALQPAGSWPDIDYTAQTRGPWKTAQHLDRLRTLSIAYRAPGQNFYNNPALKAKLLPALDFWLQHDYRNPNWWHNQIGVPQILGAVLVLLEADITPDELAKGLAILGHSNWNNEAGKPITWTGANLVWIASNRIVLGCLSKSPAIVDEAFTKIFNEIHVARSHQEGIQADWSFHQHGDVLYSGGYGQAFIGETARFMDFARGTRFAAPPERLQILTSYALDGQQWMIRGNVWDYGVTGRELTRAGKNAGSLAGTLRILASLPGPRQQELTTFAQRLSGARNVAPLVGNRHFWKSDFMAHHRAGYYTSARMFSTRTLNTDGYINSENKKTHHIADGANFIYRTGNEYKDIFPVWDWLRIPGTTVEQNPAPLNPAKVQERGKTSFVGGVSDGTYGLAVMDLARDDLTAKKAWFYFDAEWVCLGAGINSTSGNPVLTSLNQCLLNGLVTVSGEAQPLVAGERDLPAARWVMHDNIGYFFPTPTRAHLKNQAQTGSWAAIGTGANMTISKDVFSLWLDHGAKVSNGSYAYVVVPNTDRAGLEARSQKTDVEILSNTPILQAVRNNGLKLLEVAFWQAGKLEAGAGWNITADKPCLLLMREMPDGVQIALSNPENKAATVNVEVDRSLKGEGCVPIAGATRLHFDLPDGEDAGRSVVRTVAGH